MKFTTLVAASCLLAALAPVAKAQDMFTFDNQSVSPPNFLQNGEVLAANNDPAQMATFTVTGGGPGFGANIAYEFESNGPTNNPNYGTNLNDVVLTNADALPNTALTLTFSKPIDSLSLQFAIIDGTLGIPLTSLTLSEGSVHDTSTGTLNFVSTNFQGSLTVSSVSLFSTVSLHFNELFPFTDFGYAIDDITTSPAASTVPEPGVVVLFLAGIIPAAGFLRRRRAR